MDNTGKLCIITLIAIGMLMLPGVSAIQLPQIQQQNAMAQSQAATQQQMS